MRTAQIDQWTKSPYSAPTSDNCVEVRNLPKGGMAVRHSRNPGPVLEFTEGEWAAFIAWVKDGGVG